MRLSIVFALAASLIACGSPAPPLYAPTVTGAREPISAPRSPDGAPNAPTGANPPAPAPRCRLTVTESEGCGPRDVEALIAPVRTRIENCRGPNGGKLRVRIRKVAGRLAFEAESGSSLDPTEKQCVLDALTTIHADESSTAWTGLNVRPTGFTSLLTIEW